MLIHLAFAFFCSIFFSLILTYVFKRRAPGPFGGVLYFFSIIFLFTMGLGLLLTPVGPMYKNVPWLSIAAVGLVVMLLIAELLPHKDKGVVFKEKKVLSDDERNEKILEIEFRIILFIIAVIFILGVIYAITSKPDTFKMTF